MSYSKSELKRIEALKIKATFNVPDFLEDESNRLFALVDQDAVAALLAKQMDVESIDGERLSDFIVELVEAQAIFECEKRVADVEQMIIDKAS